MDVNVLGNGKYELMSPFLYYSHRYHNWIIVERGIYDGATGGIDIMSKSWFVHDQICRNPFWHNGTPITSIVAAEILSDILKHEGRPYRAFFWKWATFLFGCSKARKNGWFKCKKCRKNK